MVKRTYKTEGIILKRNNLSEADKLLTVFTPRLGKITLLAKGIRKIHSRKAPHLELFNVAKLNIAKGRNLDIVTEAEMGTCYRNLRSNIDRVAYAYRIVEIIDRLCAEGQEHLKIYSDLLSVLDKLNRAEVAKLAEIVDRFTLNLLWELGFLPREKYLSGDPLSKFLESVTERKLKSDKLLSRI